MWAWVHTHVEASSQAKGSCLRGLLLQFFDAGSHGELGLTH